MEILSFKQLEVVNLIDGKILGTISDFTIDLSEGKINSIIIPGNFKFSAIFNNQEEYVVPWSDIKKIGKEVILVSYQKSYIE